MKHLKVLAACLAIAALYLLVPSSPPETASAPGPAASFGLTVRKGQAVPGVSLVSNAGESLQPAKADK